MHKKIAAMTGLHGIREIDGTSVDHDPHMMHKFLMEEKREMHDGKPVHPSLQKYH